MQELAHDTLNNIFQTSESTLFSFEYQNHSAEFTKNLLNENDKEREMLEMGKKGNRKSISIPQEDASIDYFFEYIQIFIKKRKVKKFLNEFNISY